MLNPLAEARALIEEAARLLDGAKRSNEAHQADSLARHIEQIEAALEAESNRANDEFNAHCARYELTTGRDIDAGRLGLRDMIAPIEAALAPSAGEIEQRFGVA